MNVSLLVRYSLVLFAGSLLGYCLRENKQSPPGANREPKPSHCISPMPVPSWNAEGVIMFPGVDTEFAPYKMPEQEHRQAGIRQTFRL